MNADNAGTESEEVRVRMPAEMVDRVDDLCLAGGFATRGQVVAAAIHDAVNDDR